MDRIKLLTQVEKESIIAEYLDTNISSRKLAKQHKISHSIILLWAKEYKDNILGYKNKSKKEQSLESLPSDMKQLQKELRLARLENKLLNAVIDIAEKELKVDIRKKSGSKQ
jgi:transposase-like protein